MKDRTPTNLREAIRFIKDMQRHVHFSKHDYEVIKEVTYKLWLHQRELEKQRMIELGI